MNQVPNSVPQKFADNAVSQALSSASLTPTWIAHALGLSSFLTSGSDGLQPFSGIITDSRKVTPGCLFIALPGEKFDGHQFIESAWKQGARGILCRKDFAVSTELRQAADSGKIFIFPVEDTLRAYRVLALFWRQPFSIPIIAVAGSVGKTTTKEILAAILQGKWPKILKTQGSQNGFIGIPMTLLELSSEHSAAVIEIGIDEPGAMHQHLQLVNPSACILTAIGPEHLETLIDLETVAHEEGIALSFTAQANPNAHSIAIHLDDPWIRPHWEKIREGKKWGYTLDPELKNWAQAQDPKAAGVFLGRLDSKGVLWVDGPGLGNEPFELPLVGLHNVRNALGAITVAVSLGLSAQEIRQGLKTFQGAPGRSEIKELPGCTPVICDYYNAQPASMAAGLDLLEQIARPRQLTRWACLGDMLEMGTQEEQFHRELGGKIFSQKIENVLLYGPRMRFLQDELKKLGFSGFFEHFSTHAELAQAMIARIQPGEAVLIKGSRGMKMEEVWKLLESHSLQNWKLR